MNLRDRFPSPYSEKDAEAFIHLATYGERNYFFAITLDDELIGSCGGSVKNDIYSKTAEIGYWIGEEYWGKGFATQAIKLVTEKMFAKTEIVRIYAEPFSHNTASRRALEKAGYQLEAVLRNNAVKHGVVIDSCIYALLREEFI